MSDQNLNRFVSTINIDMKCNIKITMAVVEVLKLYKSIKGFMYNYYILKHKYLHYTPNNPTAV